MAFTEPQAKPCDMNSPYDPTVYPGNMLEDIAEKVNGEHLTALPDDWQPSIEYAVSLLTEREAGVLKLRYQQGLILDDIGRAYGVTRERIRQVLYKALRKLTHPHKWIFIKCGISAAIKAAEDKAREEGFQNGYRRGVHDAQCYSKLDLRGDVDLCDLDLSVRSYNCLCRAGVKTGSDIVGMGFDRLIRVRNFGRRSYEEVIKKLGALGYDTTGLMPPVKQVDSLEDTEHNCRSER